MLVSELNKKTVPNTVRTFIVPRGSWVKLSSLCANQSRGLAGTLADLTSPASQNVPDCKFAGSEKPMLITRSIMHLVYNG